MNLTITIGWSREGIYHENKSFIMTDVDPNVKVSELINSLRDYPITSRMRLYIDHLYLRNHASNEDLAPNMTLLENGVTENAVLRLLCTLK